MALFTMRKELKIKETGKENHLFCILPPFYHPSCKFYQGYDRLEKCPI
jgi:hypothetical protein